MVISTVTVIGLKAFSANFFLDAIVLNPSNPRINTVTNKIHFSFTEIYVSPFVTHSYTPLIINSNKHTVLRKEILIVNEFLPWHII